MARRDGWVVPVVIDPHADRESLIGSRWRRRDGEDEAQYVVTGVFDLGNDYGGLEIVFTSVDFGPTHTASVESFAEGFTRVSDDDPVERLDKVLADIEART